MNAVVKRGANDDGIVALAEHFRGTPPHAAVHRVHGRRPHERLAPRRRRLRATRSSRTIDAVWPLEPLEPARADETARRFRYRDGAGEIGVIASVTQPFCGGCSRARLSAEGRLHTCLFALKGHDLRAPLRLGAADEELAELIRGIWGTRTDRYSELRTAETSALPKVEMSYIGG